MPLFDRVEIELVNRCNNDCSFCPVNKNDDPRIFKRMDDATYYSIIEQLHALNFKGSLGLYSNNEPLMDNRIYEFARIAKETLPSACIYIFTNGLLLNLKRFQRLVAYLDLIIIDIYSDDQLLPPNIKQIFNYCLKNTELDRKVKFFIKRKTMPRQTRGGTSPNRKPLQQVFRSPCLRPFTEVVIRPDGRLSLCCNDALGQKTMGDLTQVPLKEIWQNNHYCHVNFQVSDKVEIILSAHPWL
jgi:MoaA/NifB/PqqE/SkfB family radical SAM enzyme